MKIRFALLTLFIVFLFSGCARKDITAYAETKPVFTLEEYFSGKIKTYGVIKNRSGDATRSFTAILEGKWQGEQGTLEEWFVYDDGEKQHRLWKLTKMGENYYEGTAEDVIGKGIFKTSGNAMQAEYTLEIPYKGDTVTIDLEDWFYLQPDGVLLNHAYMTKFGFSVGEIIMSHKKVEK